MHEDKRLFTIVIPVHNGSSTLTKTLESLKNQTHQDLVSQIIIINDGSTDNSVDNIREFIKTSNYTVSVIKHKYPKGLAQSYNQAIIKSKSQMVIIMHQDVLITNKNSFGILAKIFTDKDLFCAYPTILHPKRIWNQYNFWQKCLFSRYVNVIHSLPIQKFDCFNRQKLINIGLFDTKHFRTAGEDIEMIIQSKKHGFKSIKSGIKVIHIHNTQKNFSFRNLLKKEMQLAETKGVLLRLHGPFIPIYKSFFREVILLGLVFYYTRPLSVLLFILYIFFYNWRLFLIKDKHKIFLPLVNIALFISNIYSTIKSFAAGKQTI